MNNKKPCCNKKVLHKDGTLQILTPYPKKGITTHLELSLGRYTHIMGLWRSVVLTLIFILQIWKIL